MLMICSGACPSRAIALPAVSPDATDSNMAPGPALAGTATSLRSLLSYLRQGEHRARNPPTAVATLKRPQRLPVYLSPRECQRLPGATDSDHYLRIFTPRDPNVAAIILR